MNKAKFLTLMVVELLSIFTSLNKAHSHTATLAASGGDGFVRESNQEILSATIQIRLYPQGFNTGNVSKTETQYYERGFGTLVSQVGGLYIYTHDHWGLIDNPGKAQFYNYLGELLLEISGEAIKNLIFYRDGGMMILVAPIELQSKNLNTLVSTSVAKARTSLQAVEIGAQGGVEVGDIVVITRKLPGDSDRVDLLPATIVSFEYHEGIPVIKLRSQNGENLVPGDSGGGIWLNGRLIANMWMNERIYDWRFWTWKSLKPALKRVDTSIAALTPDGSEGFILNNNDHLNSQEVRLLLGE